MSGDPAMRDAEYSARKNYTGIQRIPAYTKNKLSGFKKTG